ncbi:hypothetical protein RRG08_030542 [Elysia crispata]|uniref:BESS domain-containing protein n=1 Tax=Elysia crispata TaxID=231223 RepID=A0AAE0YHH9_9GAST|nr:hypothetical protein RRG08_030542 [Elysia crispata]
MFSPPPNTAPNVRPPKTLQRKKRPYPQERRSSVSPFDTEMLSLQQQQLQKQQRVPHDDDGQFLLGLLPVLRSLDPISKFELREELNDTALRYLRRNSDENADSATPRRSRIFFRRRWNGHGTGGNSLSPSTSPFQSQPVFCTGTGTGRRRVYSV